MKYRIYKSKNHYIVKKSRLGLFWVTMGEERLGLPECDLYFSPFKFNTEQEAYDFIISKGKKDKEILVLEI